MKIGFDAKRALNNSTGLGNHARILLNALKRDFPDNEYLLFSPKIKQEYLADFGRRFQLILPSQQFSKILHPLWRSFGLNKTLALNKVDVYHGLSNELPFNIHRSSLKSVVTIHDLIFLKHTEQYPWADRQFYTAKTKYAAKYAHHIIAVSQETKNDLLERYGVDENRITVIYPSVDPSFYQPAVVKLALSQVKYILNVGSFVPRKNQRKLIEAYSLIEKEVEEELWLAGRGNMANEVSDFIHQKGLEKRVKILADVRNEKLPALYQNASVFVFPSLFEGFGAPVLEALYSGTPVIATKYGAIAEAAGNSSLLIDPTSAEDMAEKMLQVLSDATLQKQMINQGLSHAQTMSDNVFAAKTMQVYAKV